MSGASAPLQGPNVIPAAAQITALQSSTCKERPSDNPTEKKLVMLNMQFTELTHFLPNISAFDQPADGWMDLNSDLFPPAKTKGLAWHSGTARYS